MNSSHQRKFTSNTLKLTALMGLSLMTTTGNAYYTVVEEDIAPTRPSIVAPAPARAPLIDQYAIPFPKGSTPINSMSRAVLDALFPKIANDAQIRIVGRPDAMYASSEEAGLIPRKRAVNMRDYLTRKGIPISSIVIETDNTPNPQIDGSTYPSYIYVTRVGKADFSAATLSQPEPSPRRYQAAEMITEVTPQPNRLTAQKQNYRDAPATMQMEISEAPSRQFATAQAPNSSKDKLMAYINAGVQSGVMSPTVALQLLQALMESEPGNPTPMASYKSVKQIAPLQPLAEPQFTQSPPASIAKQIWVLEKSLTLRENLDAWSKSAGWNPVAWDASNFYQVSNTVVIKGDFPEILRKVAESTGLNICATPRLKIVRITNSDTACK